MTNFVREKLSHGKSVCGIWSIIPSPVLTEIVSLSKFDFQIFDMEHGVYDFGTLDIAIRSSENNGCSPFVRVPGLDAVATQKALDLGAHGIIFPQVQNSEDTLNAVKLTKYNPVGNRGFNPFTRGSNYSIRKTDLKNRNHNDFAFTSIIVENKSAAKNLDAILDTENLEIIYLGAYDMSVALGCPGDMKNLELLSFLEKSITKICKAKKVAGVMAQTPEEMQRYVSLGAKFVVLGVDSFLIGESLSSIQNQFSKIL